MAIFASEADLPRRFSSALVPPNGLPTFGERANPLSVAGCKVRVSMAG
jgi:hypothetical protein